MRAVALVDVLDDLLALVARWQIEIDVGPLAALFGEEALEEQLHLHRVDGGDGQGVADRGVGGRAAALGHDLLALAEADDIPDDEEVAREIELLDEVELFLDLGLGAGGERPVAGAGAVPGDLAEIGVGGLGVRQGVVGEAVAEIGEGELELVGELGRGAHRPRVIGEEGGDLGGGAQVALALGLDDGARGVEGDALADAGEDIGELLVLARGVADAAGGDDGQPEAAGELEHGLVAVLLVAEVVALELDVEAAGEEIGEAGELAAGAVETAVEEALVDAGPRRRR